MDQVIAEVQQLTADLGGKASTQEIGDVVARGGLRSASWPWEALAASPRLN